MNSPATNRDISAKVYEASQAKFWPSYRTSVTQSLIVFAAGAALVLLLTCANISSLLLSRSTTRRVEFAIRLAVGAGRARLVRQLLTESVLLISPSCALALAIAGGFGRVLAKFPNAFGLPMALDAGIEIRVFCFCLVLSVVTALIFGLVPAALQSTRQAVLPALRASGQCGHAEAEDRSGRETSCWFCRLRFRWSCSWAVVCLGVLIRAWSIGRRISDERCAHHCVQ